MNCLKSNHCCFLALFLALSLQGFTHPVSAQETVAEEPRTLEEAVDRVPTEGITLRVERTRAFLEELQSEMVSDFSLLTIQEGIPETERTLASWNYLNGKIEFKEPIQTVVEAKCWHFLRHSRCGLRPSSSTSVWDHQEIRFGRKRSV